jgi:hypothetical protein
MGLKGSSRRHQFAAGHVRDAWSRQSIVACAGQRGHVPGRGSAASGPRCRRRAEPLSAARDRSLARGACRQRPHRRRPRRSAPHGRAAGAARGSRGGEDREQCAACRRRARWSSRRAGRRAPRTRAGRCRRSRSARTTARAAARRCTPARTRSAPQASSCLPSRSMAFGSMACHSGPGLGRVRTGACNAWVKRTGHYTAALLGAGSLRGRAPMRRGQSPLLVRKVRGVTRYTSQRGAVGHRRPRRAGCTLRGVS